jgi:hypothetical protein
MSSKVLQIEEAFTMQTILPKELIRISSKVQRDFEDYVQHGDDFFKIELWRPAKAWYYKALELGIDSERIKRKIAECERGIAFELKVIWILLAIAASIVTLITLL